MQLRRTDEKPFIDETRRDEKAKIRDTNLNKISPRVMFHRQPMANRRYPEKRGSYRRDPWNLVFDTTCALFMPSTCHFQMTSLGLFTIIDSLLNQPNQSFSSFFKMMKQRNDFSGL